MTQTIRPYIINVDGQKKLCITYVFASRNFPDLSYSYLCKDIQLNYEKTPAQETAQIGKIKYGKLYEIARYQHDSFQYFVTTTDKHTEEDVRQDIEHFDTILGNEMKSHFIGYVLATGLTQKWQKD